MADTCKLCKWGIISIVVGYFIIYLITRIVEKQPFAEYYEYQDNILAGIGIVFGVLGVVTFYYIGKFHDLTIELIKARAEHRENYEKMMMMSKIKHMDISEELQKEIDHEKKFDPNYDEQKNIVQDVHNKILREAIIIGTFLTLIILSFFMHSNNSTLNNFVNSISGLISGIILFVISWILYNHLLMRLINVLDLDYQVTSKIKVIVYKLEKKAE